MKKILTAISLLAMTFTANAQRDMMLSQQFFSRLNINPAATGNRLVPVGSLAVDKRRRRAKIGCIKRKRLLRGHSFRHRFVDVVRRHRYQQPHLQL